MMVNNWYIISWDIMVNDGQINPMGVFKSPRAGQFGAPDAVPARESSDDVHGLQRCGKVIVI